MRSIVLAVTGGRKYAREDVVFAALDELAEEFEITLLVEGGATGADSHARSWAKSRGVRSMREDAEWRKLGPSAGNVRNLRVILKYKPDLLAAFPGGSGTEDMVLQCERMGIEVRRYPR